MLWAEPGGYEADDECTNDEQVKWFQPLQLLKYVLLEQRVSQ